jgi:hypothetical protein
MTGSPDPIGRVTETLVKPIALLKVQILIFGSIAGIALLAFGHFESALLIKCPLMFSGAVAFFGAGGFYGVCVKNGYAGNSYERAVAEQGAKIIATHKRQVDTKPSRKREVRPRLSQENTSIREDNCL